MTEETKFRVERKVHHLFWGREIVRSYNCQIKKLNSVAQMNSPKKYALNEPSIVPGMEGTNEYGRAVSSQS